jgi:two-component system NtrC family sensor kinase
MASTGETGAAGGSEARTEPPPSPPPGRAGRGSLDSVPWRDRLSTQLLGVVVVLVAAAVIAFALVEVFIARQRMGGVGNSAEMVSEGIKGAIRHAMIDDQRPQAYEIIRDIARNPAIDHVRLINKEGLITFSTVAGEAGRMVDKRAEGCRACHGPDETLISPPEAGRRRVYDGQGRRVMAVVTPFPNESGCSVAACHAHPAGKQVLGVLDVGLSLANVDRDLAAFRRANLAVTGAAALVLVVFFWAFARRRVVRPVEALVAATRRVARDELDTEIQLDARGELGLLAASFNDMIRSLRRVEDELRLVTGSLEAKVEERTAELRAAQDTLVRTEKLSSLGKLSASIAHEINNPLAGILTFAKLMIRTIEHGPVGDAERRTLVKQLALVQRETERCSAIVRNLLDFARERPLQLKEVNLNAVVDEVFSLIANQTAIQGVQMAKDAAPLPPVEADFGQMRQAFVNIAMNAVEAMPKGGHITVTTRPLPGEDAVEIVFADDGPGIPPELMQKIFDPFFTTKEKGTGLGLSVVYGIVERHKGRVSVDSEPGKGTRFTIRLPAARR